MDDAIAGARAARSALERLGARVPGFAGYLERELRREMDQRLRLELALRVDRARDAVLRYLGHMPLRSPDVGRLAAAEKALDGWANRLRHAGSGYAGIFDAIKVGESELTALYRYDEALADAVDAVLEAAATLGRGEDASAALETAIETLGTRISGRSAALQATRPVPA